MSQQPETSETPKEDGRRSSCSEDSEDMMNMFASVWVKVESLEVDEKNSVVLPSTDLNPIDASNPKKKRKVYQCTQCDYTTTHNPHLKVHVFSHSNTELSCQYCDYKSKWPMSIKRHIYIKHGITDKPMKEKPKGEFACEHCDYTTVYKWNLNAHKRKHKLDKTFKCKECHYESAYRHNYLKHCQTHEESTRTGSYKCDQCPFETMFKGHIKRHVAKIHNVVLENVRYSCERCGFRTDEKFRLKMHEQRSELKKVIRCGFCKFQTFYKCESKKHRQIHFRDIELGGRDNIYQFQNENLSENRTEKSDKNETVEMVDKSVDNADNSVETVEKAADIEDDDAYFRCKHCIFETLYKGILERHLAQVHKEITEYEHKCQYCNFSTKEKFRLDQHRRNSKGDKKLQCNLCNFETFFKCESKKHRQTHFNEIYGNGRKIDCSNLNDQVETMIQENQYQGNSIDLAEAGENSVESIDADGNINNDERTDEDASAKRHSDYQLDPDCVEWSTIQVLETPGKDRPFQCNFCQYSSKFKASVQRHFQRQHAGNQNRPYKCCNCDFKTKTKEQITLHNKRSQSLTELTCESCSYATVFKCALTNHQKQHHLFKCTLCSYSCNKKYDLTKHFATYHMGSGLKCQYCDFTAVRKESILSHEAIHTGCKPYRCKLCSYSSVRKTLLMNHYRRRHCNDNSRS